MKNIFASLVTIGDELLIGQVVDTNSSYIARKLNEAGISIKRRVAVGDNHHEIYDALNKESIDSQIVLITGGLGPTKDDLTKDALCRYFEGTLIVNEEAEQNVRNLFENIYRKPVSELNLLQAKVPDVCEVIQNRRGSAPGMIFRKKGVVFISMPGIPYEMEGIMEEVIPYLKNLFELPVIVHKTILTAGIGESALAEKIADFENSLPREIKLAYLPNYGMVRLRLSSVIFANRLNEPTILQEFELLKKLVEDYIVTDEDETMEMVLGKVLTSAGKTVSTAESCTGGRIAALITSVPGASNYFEGGIVSYSNDIKKNNLQVKEETLNLYGAVSEEAAKEMLTGLLKKFSTDFGIAVTGIMGPDGGTPEKPVGTVWVAVGNKDSYVSRCFHQRFKRSKNIEVTSVMAINMLREFILKSS